MLKKLTMVVDVSLWGDTWEEQMNCIEQALINSRGKNTKYPIEWSDYIYPNRGTKDKYMVQWEEIEKRALKVADTLTKGRID